MPRIIEKGVFHLVMSYRHVTNALMLTIDMAWSPGERDKTSGGKDRRSRNKSRANYISIQGSDSLGNIVRYVSDISCKASSNAM